MTQTQIKIIEPEIVIKIATGQPIGVVDEALLDPANMSSGTATAGQIPTADGAGGIAWADDVGPVPVSRQIISGSGLTGGGDLSTDRTLAVNQGALDPSNMSSGGAGAGQLPTASGAGAIAWSDPPASVGLPGSSTDNALTRWDGAGGNAIQNSNVTLSDSDAMVFPTAGSISKPGAGANSEAFGAGAVAAGTSGIALGHDANASGAGGVAIGIGAIASNIYSIAIGGSANNTGNTSLCLGAAATVTGNYGTLVGSGSSIGTGSFNVSLGYSIQIPDATGYIVAIGAQAVANQANVVVVGQGAKVHGVSSADSIGSIALGQNAIVGNATPGAGCNAAIAIGENATVAAGSIDSVVIGSNATIGTSCFHSVIVGASASISNSSIYCVVLGQNATVTNGADRTIVIGRSASVSANSGMAIGYGTIASQTNAMAIGYSALTEDINGVAFGQSAKVYLPNSGSSAGSVAIGSNSIVGNNAQPGCAAAVAIGYAADVRGGSINGIAIGASSICNAADSITVGYTSYTYGIGSIAIGDVARVHSTNSGDNDGAICIGSGAEIGDVTPGAGCDASIAIGEGAKVFPASLDAVAIGKGAQGQQSRAVAIGYTALGIGSFGIAVGNAAWAESYGVSIAAESRALAEASIAIGRSARVWSPSSGNNTGAIAIGDNADAGASSADPVNAAISIGRNSSVGPGALAAISLGYGANIRAVSSGDSIGAICIGSGAEIGNVTPGAGCDASIAIGENAVINTGSIDSVLIGAGGSISANSVGCTVVGQGASITGGADRSSVFGKGATVAGTNCTAIGYGAIVNQTNALAVGYQSLAEEVGTVTLGAATKVYTPNSGTSAGAMAIGYAAKVGSNSDAGCDLAIAIGSSADVRGGSTNAIAIGGSAICLAADTIVIGYTAFSYGLGGVAIGDVARVHSTNSGDNNGAIAIGDGAYVGAVGAPGCNASIAIGEAAHINNGKTDAIAIGPGAIGNHADAIALGRNATTTANNRCTIGTIGGAADKELQIGKGLAAFGATPPASQPAKISDATDLTSAITAINAIIDVLEGAGLSSAV